MQKHSIAKVLLFLCLGSLPDAFLGGFFQARLKPEKMKISSAVPFVVILSAQPAFASSYPDLTLFFWGYPMLVSLLASLFIWLNLRARRRRLSLSLLLGAFGVSTVVGKATVGACLDLTGDFVGAFLLWTGLIATCSGFGTFFSSSPLPITETAEPDDIGPSNSG